MFINKISLGLICTILIMPFLNVSAITAAEFKAMAARANLKAKTFDPISRGFLASNCLNGTVENGLKTVNESLLTKLKLLTAGKINKEQLLIVDQLCGISQVLTLLNERDITLEKREFVKFLFSSHERIRILGEAFQPEDEVSEAFSILEELYKPESVKERDEYFDLKLAMALVWDQKRPLIHEQVDYSFTTKYEADLPGRYLYFKTLYDKNKAKLNYRYLDYKDLIYVVDTPVPLTELEWTLKYIKGSLASWGQKYSSVNYDKKRLNDGIYDWPGDYNGHYSLRNISKFGGICVDQAYYCTITARAFGIPALYFEGMGKRGGHAWCSFMKKEDSWALDVGRYQNDKYMTGDSLNPQTNKKMTDHEVSLIYDRAFRKSTYKKGHQYQFFANFLFDSDETVLATSFAAYAVKMAPLNTRCWNILEKCMIKANNVDKMLKFFDEKIKKFKKFSDIVVKTQIEKIDYLNDNGRQAESVKLLDVTRRRVDKKRDDLERLLSLKVVKDLMKQGEKVDARKEMESTLKKQTSLNAKIFNYIEKYLELTKETGQEKEAARFLAILMKPMFTKLFTHDKYKAVELLATGYNNNNDSKKAELLMKRYLK